MDKETKNSLDQLLKEIKSSEVHKTFKEEQQNWENAKDSQKLLNDFTEARSTLGIFQQGGFDGITEQRKKVMKLYDEIQKDKNINNWDKAQRDYQQFIQELVDYLSKELDFNIAPAQGGGCCG